MCACVRACVRVCVRAGWRASVRACVRACVRVCVCMVTTEDIHMNTHLTEDSVLTEDVLG